ncbi:MAG: ABC transporter permease [Bacteroidales bacterium]|nr:ABC transporter permease [Bacteroidales bacterium]
MKDKKTSAMLIILRLIRESYLFAFHELRVKMGRTILALLGITIGIFCVISVLSVFDSLEVKIRSSIESLGDNVVYVQKWPWMFSSNYPWWKYIKRPVPTLEEMKAIQQRCYTADAVAFIMGSNRTIKFRSKSIENTSVMAISHDYDKTRSFELGLGRYFSPMESANGRNIIILGSDVSSQLFGQTEPIGQMVKIFGRKLEVVGVLKKEGEGLGESLDQQVIVPINYAINVLDIDRDGALIVKAKPGIAKQELIDDLTGIMRSVRHLRPGQEDNFSINEISLISNTFDQFFNVMAIIGWVIGGFSLLVGGFGIANIMFVSVKERTRIIGLQKSLGAKNYFILLQFLFESVFLSLFGGIAGLLIIYFMSLIVQHAFDFEMILSTGNIILGLSVSIIIGFVSGIIPSYNAARLDPVEAMRSTF